MADLNAILDSIKELKLLEVAELVKMMEDEFGVSAAAPVMVAGAADGAAAGRTGAPLLIPFHTHAGRAKGSPGIFHKKDAESCICQVQKNSIYSPY